jgi:hypothetical protein
MKLLRRWLILTHRYGGIALSLLFAVWFISGIAMIYARGMPRLDPDTRLERLPALDFGSIKFTPAEAAEKAALERAGRPMLLTVMGRPAYRFAGRRPTTVFADTGDLLEDVGQAEALKIAGDFMNLPPGQFTYTGEVSRPDQWTISEAGQLPMHRFSVDDGAGTVVYISERSGEVGLITTRGSRALAWIAAIPHWFYFAPLRLNAPVWRQVVLWTAGAGAVLLLLGLILAISQYSTRYTGLMRWHYVTGVIFGVISLTFVFSGMLSMEPFFWASEPGAVDGIPQALTGGGLDLSAFPPMQPDAWRQVMSGRPVKEVEYRRIQDMPFYVVRGVEAEPLLLSADPLEVRREPFSMESVLGRVKDANPEMPIMETQVLDAYDSYYYPRAGKPPLPVLRVKFGDPESTWVYVDPQMSQVVGSVTSRQRLQRWIYNAFHSLDFNFWYYQGAAWQAGIIALNAGGALLSVIGVMLSIKRVARGLRIRH